MICNDSNQNSAVKDYSSFRTIFSCLYNESEEFLDLFIFNFISHTDDSALLVINLSEKSQHLVKDKSGSGRVLFKKHGAPRTAWGHTLLGGHIENFRLAQQIVITFEYFVTMASNSLFFRPFDLNATIKMAESNADAKHALGYLVEELPGWWHWPSLRATQDLTNRLHENWEIRRFSQNTIEGLFAIQKNWSIVADVYEDVAEHCAGLTSPLEEILPSTIWRHYEINFFTNICHMYWDRYNNGLMREATIRDISRPDQLSQTICMQKWFGRSCLAPETLAVCTPVGLELIRAIKSIQSVDDYMGVHALLKECFRELESKEVRKSLLSLLSLFEASHNGNFGNIETKYENLRHSAKFECTANRQKIEIEGIVLSDTVGGAKPYLFMEDSKIDVSIKTEFHTSGLTFGMLRLECESVEMRNENPKSLPELLAYLYIPIILPVSRNGFISLDIKSKPVRYANEMARAIVLQGLEYKPLSPVQMTAIPGGATAKYVIDIHMHQDFIGIPIYLNVSSEVQIDLVEFVST